MRYRVLGKTGLNISAMGFGGIPIQRIDSEGTKVLMHRLHQEGVNYIDTARGYTVSEEYLGYALEGIRQHFVLATKSMARDKAGMEQDVETSLRNLRTDYIDLYQFHNPSLANFDQIVAPGGALEALQEAKAAGKIGHIGITMHDLKVFERALECEWVETIMFPYNIVETHAQELIDKCAEKNIGFVCMKPLAGGALENATLAIRFVCANENISVVIPGMADVCELEQNLAAANDESPLTAQELSAMQKIRDELGTNFCRRCNYCQPCTAGVNISGAFLFEGYYNRYGLQEWAKGRYLAMPKTASDCVDCGLCEERCPYHLPIREMLKNVAKVFGK